MLNGTLGEVRRLLCGQSDGEAMHGASAAASGVGVIASASASCGAGAGDDADDASASGSGLVFGASGPGRYELKNDEWPLLTPTQAAAREALAMERDLLFPPTPPDASGTSAE